uniref:EGF-like domain-containing protein n=1 Tax=Schistosoma mansoni TaxID=6183 RepID=A0A5K4F562_SCHMA
MYKIIYYYLLYYLSIFNLIHATNSNELSRLNLLTLDRSTNKINILLSYFIPFNDMIHIQSRRQQYNGIKENFLIKNLNNLYINHQIFINLTNFVDYYYKLIINKPITINDGNIINNNNTDYLHNIHIMKYTNINYIKKVYKKSLLLLLSKEYIPSSQLKYILLMHSWRLYFLFIINNTNLWLHFKPETIIDQNDLPKTIDEWSIIFIYLLCITFQSKQYDKDYQLPYGFCPNPCLMNPCHEVMNTISNKCIRTGYLENNYKCECRNGYQWKQVKGYKGNKKMFVYLNDFTINHEDN